MQMRGENRWKIPKISIKLNLSSLDPQMNLQKFNTILVDFYEFFKNLFRINYANEGRKSWKKIPKKSSKFQIKLNSTLSASSSSNIIKLNLKDFLKNYFRINYANECPNSPRKKIPQKFK